MQADLFTSDTPPLARRTDPATSHAAAEAAHDAQARHQREILEALRCHGRMGKSGIAARSRLTEYQVSKRLSELARAGRIEPTGRTVPSLAGRAEREWQVVR